MKEFLHFYRWGMEVKLNMAIYTIALIFFKSIVALTQGESSVNIWLMLEMLLVSFAFAILQYALFPGDRTLPRRELAIRTAVWAVCGNVLYAGGAVAFGWFAGVPLWGAAVLALVLEGGLWAMWFGDQVARRRDTKTLNDKLRSYQQE